MATEIAKAYVQILPTTKGIKSELTKQMGGDVEEAGKESGGIFGSGLVSKLKAVVAAAGIGAIIKNALDAGGAIQQSFGGLDTLYGEASEAAKKYAKEAAAAGISMNDYAEQAVSFGAGLKQAFKGDVKKSVEAANTAILDMADNAAKMGTPLESIQNAYQGFAKSNYTMLDNLKLGYGGTKKEMERLLADAEKISGVKYNLDNLGDVYEAIHVVQGELGLTGVAADEASTTFTGSMGAMKAAATNFLAELTTGGDITDSLTTLINGAFTFLRGNLFPMLGNLFRALPDVLNSLFSGALEGLSALVEDSPNIVRTVIAVIKSLLASIATNLPLLIQGVVSAAVEIGKVIMNRDWGYVARSTIENIKNGLMKSAKEILGTDKSIVDTILSSITDNLPRILDKGIEIITNLANGFLKNLPTFISAAGQMITKFINFIGQNLPVIMQKGFELLSKLASGITKNLPTIVSTVAQVIAKIVASIGQNLPKILQTGVEILMKIVTGILNAIPKLIAALPQVINSVKNAFSKYDWKSIGKNIIEGIKKGFLNAITGLLTAAKNAAKSVLNAAKSALGIHSPSRLFREEVGKMIPAGMAIGIDANADKVTAAMDELTDATFTTATRGLDYSVTYGQSVQPAKQTDVSQIVELLSQYLPGLANQQIYLDGNALVGGIANPMDKALGQIAAGKVRYV